MVAASRSPNVSQQAYDGLKVEGNEGNVSGVWVQGVGRGVCQFGAAVPQGSHAVVCSSGLAPAQ